MVHSLSFKLSAIHYSNSHRSKQQTTVTKPPESEDSGPEVHISRCSTPLQSTPNTVICTFDRQTEVIFVLNARLKKIEKWVREEELRKQWGTPFGFHTPTTLREKESSNKINVHVKSKLKHQHLQKLAVWAATGEEGSNPSLAAFFGQRLAAVGEATGIQPDPSVFTCQRCETVLQPGINSTFRIEKNRKKHRNNKSSNSMQNNVVHTCHFCSHKNLKRGTPKGHMKEICPLKVKPSSKSKPATPIIKKCSLEDTRTKEEVLEVADVILPDIVGDIPIGENLGTPLSKEGTRTTLLDSKSKKRNRSASKKADKPQNISTAENTISASSKKKRRKSWTGLKEIVGQDRSRGITDIKLPLFL